MFCIIFLDLDMGQGKSDKYYVVVNVVILKYVLGVMWLWMLFFSFQTTKYILFPEHPIQ